MSKIEDQIKLKISKQIRSNHPKEARKMILRALQAFQLLQTVRPVKQKPESRRYLAKVCVQFMIDSLKKPEKTVMTSIYMPAEILQSAGMIPMCAEMFATFMNGVQAEETMISVAEEAGISETFCSYHKVVMGAAISKVLPASKWIVNSSLACDANNLTFRSLSHSTGAPQYYIDVPYRRDEESVDYVADQLRDITEVLKSEGGFSEEILNETVNRARMTIENMLKVKQYRRSRYLPGDLTSELYEVLMMHTGLGTKEALKYSQLLLKDYENAPVDEGKRIVWMHTNPFSQKPVMDALNYNPKVHVVATELSYDEWHHYETSDPYRFMASRLVYNNYNGSMIKRVEETQKLCEELDAAGVILFCHWGCKETCGGSAIAKKMLEEAGYPTLILNGDGVDRKNNSDGQTATRLGAFIEMLEDQK